MFHNRIYIRYPKWLNLYVPSTSQWWLLSAGAELPEYNEKMLLKGYKVSIMADEFQYNKVTMANFVLCHLLEICYKVSS